MNAPRRRPVTGAGAEPGTSGVPVGFAVELDPDATWLDSSTLLAGSPPRLLRFSEAGRAAVGQLAAGPVRDRATALVARRLVDAGAAHPRPPLRHARPAVTVVIPVRDRAFELDRCLAALGEDDPVVVVDDGSDDPASIAAVASRRGAAVLRHAVNRGPAAARNTGLAAVRTPFAVLLDSDCAAGPGWFEQLAAHLDDPLVAAVAPRIRGGDASSALGRFQQARGPLDLGPRPARVAPLTRVSYVPTAALLVRCAALTAVAGANGVFDERLRYGEDVDLIWRLHDAGWRIRYDPSAQVRHHDPIRLSALLAKRFCYGTSAGQLARRHPSYLPPLVVAPWPAAAALAALARRPALAAVAIAGAAISRRASARRAGAPQLGALAATVADVRQSWLGLGRYATRFAAPLVLAAVVTPRRSVISRAAAASLLVGPPAASWLSRRPALDPARYALAHIADDIAYGAGVWRGAWRARTAVPMRPALARRGRSRTPVTPPSHPEQTTFAEEGTS